MTISGNDWSAKPRLITDIERGDHFHLEADDRCLFFGEYTARAGFEFGETNQIISNLQKPVSRRGMADYRYKGVAITKIAAAIAAASPKARAGQVVIIPAPPSKPRGHAEYDDRLERLARAIGPQADVRCALETVCARQQAKRAEHRPTIEELAASMRVVEELLDPLPSGVILLDDIITSGTTFKAAQRLLSPYLGDVKLVGLFVARRVIPPVQWDDVALV
jgi:hypothetical protein